MTEARLSTGEERFEYWRKRVGLVAGPLVFAGVWMIPIPDLASPAHRMLAVMALAGVWWLTEALPLAVTALVGPALCVLMGVASARDALRPFSDPVIFLFLGGFLLAEAMVKHGLNRRIALTVLSWPAAGRSSLGLLGGFGLLTACLSAWVSNTATAAMMVPIAVAILQELAQRQAAPGTGRPDWHSVPAAAPLILVTCFAASIGGLATPIGTPPNLIGTGLIEQALDRRLTFFEWMRFAAPAALLLTLLLIWKLHRWSQRKGRWQVEAGPWIRAERSKLGPWTAAQRGIAAAFGAAIIGWVLPGLVALGLGSSEPVTRWLFSHLPEGVVAILAAAALFILPAEGPRGSDTRILTWPDAARVDWGTILLFGGGMALGDMMFETGLAEWIGRGLASAAPSQSELALTFLFVVAGALLSEATSNTASATMIIPVSIAVAQAAGIEPLKPALGACLGSSLGFMLPVSTPPNAIAYGTGAVPLTSMISQGMWLDVAGCTVVVLCVVWLAP